MIKVLHVVSSLSVASGVMSVIMNYYRHLDKKHINFGFVYFKKTKGETYLREIEENGGECFLIKKPTVGLDYADYIKNFLVEHREYKILQIHELYLSFIFAGCAKRIGGIATIGHAHTIKYAEKPLPALRNRLLCLPNKRLLDYKFACSLEAGKAFFGRKITNDDCFFVLKNAVDISRYSFSNDLRKKYRKALGFGENDYVVGHVGRFAPAKNHSFIKKIISLTPDEDIKFVLVGDGPLKKNMESFVNEHNLGARVLLVGNRKDTYGLYNAMDSFILPSKQEGLGIVLVEAQTNGLYCIASNRVPEEAIFLNETGRYSISKPNEWVNELKKRKSGRISHSDIFAQAAGYDITKESSNLMEIYARIWNEVG